MSECLFGTVRWKICCGEKPGNVERNAVRALYGAVRGYLPYILTFCGQAPGAISPEDQVIYIGTLESNPALRELAQKGFFEPEDRREGYSVRVAPSCRDAERTDIVIQGADEVGVLYGVYDFIHYYLDHVCKYQGYHYNHQKQPFVDPCPVFERRGAPATVNRGLWTWGHMIFDYRKYIENMAACKMNMLIMWNDFVPVNACDIVTYAHSFGVKVIWGYPCSWGFQVDPTREEEIAKWENRVLEVYRDQYAVTGGDGIYFQGFTETHEKTIHGETVASLITRWVNRVTAKLHEAYPDLYVQFGIHASSIGENYREMAGITPDVTLVWEDGGGFPYHYDPRMGNDLTSVTYTQKLLELSKNSGRFGAVLKGFTVLNWTKFEHYQGPILVGETDALFRKKRAEQKKFYWDYAEPYWISKADILKAYLQVVCHGGLTESTVTALVEDGVFEEGVPKSVGIYAELLWDCDADIASILEMIYHSEHYCH